MWVYICFVVLVKLRILHSRLSVQNVKEGKNDALYIIKKITTTTYIAHG